jgi:hypothetical protein
MHPFSFLCIRVRTLNCAIHEDKDRTPTPTWFLLRNHYSLWFQTLHFTRRLPSKVGQTLLKNIANLETFSFQIFKYLPFMTIFPSHLLLLHICNWKRIIN